ncbi:hypothetical protein ACFPOE_09510 [Caenimonas terrae]|uniref:DUF2029 domain-containing protein n=1 Tax=Caenimonas terrae TaxID=696074 RepID=A0ABW0NFT2_9BURK
MTPTRLRLLAAAALPMLLPLLLVIVFAMHLRGLPQFLDFRLRYLPTPPQVIVPWLIAHGGQRPLLHDPHVIAYLALPLFLVTALRLHRLAAPGRAAASAAACMVTVVGTIYLGGLFGMWTAFYDGLARVDARDVEGATAAYAAMTSPQGAFLLTTTLAKLAFVGLALQGLVLWGRTARARAASACIIAGAALFLAFWDLDNWMLVGSVLLLVGLAMSRPAREMPEAGFTQ